MKPTSILRRGAWWLAGLFAVTGAALAEGPVTTLSAPEAYAAAQAGRLTIIDIRTPRNGARRVWPRG